MFNKLDREKLHSKVKKYKLENREKFENINEFILNELAIIKNELSKYKSIKNSNYILSVRQKHCANEFQQYIKEKKYELAFYDLEEFIQCEVYPADKLNDDFIYSRIICDKEIEIINDMIHTLEKECNI